MNHSPGSKAYGRHGQLPRTTLFCLGVACILLVSVAVATGIGPTHYSLSEVLRALRHGPPNLNGTSEVSPVELTVWSLRLPRIIMASLVGASLGCAGLAFQSLLRNDLADPYIVGVSAGASVGTEAVMLKQGEAWLHGLAAPGAAFAGAASALLFVYCLARQHGKVHVGTLLLAGVVVSAFLGSVSAVLLQLGSPGDSMHVLNRLMGSLQDSTFPQCVIVGLSLAAGFTLLLSQATAMNIFALGEDSAQHLGIHPERFKLVIILTGSLLTAAAVAFSGIIGFVGLATPHVARRMAATPNHRSVLPLTALLGATLMIWADAAARSALPEGRELPVGIVTAFLGAPFFWSQLRRRGHLS